MVNFEKNGLNFVNLPLSPAILHTDFVYHFHVFYVRHSINLSSLDFNKILSNPWRSLISIFNFFPQVIKTRPGRHLAVHYQSMTGEKFELHVHDGNTINATQLTFVNQWTGVNQALTPSLSSGHELFMKFRFSAGSNDARLKFLITDDQGKNFSHS